MNSNCCICSRETSLLPHSAQKQSQVGVRAAFPSPQDIISSRPLASACPGSKAVSVHSLKHPCSWTQVLLSKYVYHKKDFLLGSEIPSCQISESWEWPSGSSRTGHLKLLGEGTLSNATLTQWVCRGARDPACLASSQMMPLLTPLPLVPGPTEEQECRPVFLTLPDDAHHLGTNENTVSRDSSSVGQGQMPEIFTFHKYPG